MAWIIGTGDWRLFYIYKDRLEKLTLADVQTALHKYYLQSNRTWGVFIPDKGADTQRVVVAERPDINAIVKNFKGKAVQERKETLK